MGNSPGKQKEEKKTEKKIETPVEPPKPKSRQEVVMEYLTAHLVKDVALIIFSYRGDFYFEGRLLQTFTEGIHLSNPKYMVTNDKHLFILDNNSIIVFDPISSKTITTINPRTDVDPRLLQLPLSLYYSQSRRELFVLETSSIKVFSTTDDNSWNLSWKYDLRDRHLCLTGSDDTLFIAGQSTINTFSFVTTKSGEKSLKWLDSWALGWTPSSMYCDGSRVYAVGKAVHVYDLKGVRLRSVEDFGDHPPKVVYAPGEEQFLVGSDRRMLIFNGETGIYISGMKWGGYEPKFGGMTVCRGRLYVTVPQLQCWE